MGRDSDDIRRSYYVLDLEPMASKAEVEQAYREMAKIWHPDRFPNDARLRERTEQKMKEINKAREEILAYLERGGGRMGSSDSREPGAAPAWPRVELRLPPYLLRYALPLLFLLLSVLSRVPAAIALALVVLVAVLVFTSNRRS